jgi:hypothetical protein
MKKETIYALKRLGFKGYLALRYVIVFDGPKITIPVLSFDHGKRKLVCTINRLLRQIQVKKYVRSGKPFRLVLHSRDINNKAVLKELNELKEKLKSAGYRPGSFDRMINGTI